MEVVPVHVLSDNYAYLLIDRSQGDSQTRRVCRLILGSLSSLF